MKAKPQPASSQPSPPENTESLLGDHPDFQKAKEKAVQYARYRSPVLLEGETGTGKEEFAKLIHARSGRPGHLVTLHLSGLPGETIESELFGHVNGAFTGADCVREGKIEQAKGGTLFLDEFHTVPERILQKLLRVLDRKPFQKVGSNEDVYPDFRLIVASEVHLSDLVARDEFPRAIYSRISARQLRLPPLRERKSDIPLLAEQFYALALKDLQCGGCAPPGSVWNQLKSHEWWGNTRAVKSFVTTVAEDFSDATPTESDISERLRDFVLNDPRPMTMPSAASNPAGSLSEEEAFYQALQDLLDSMTADDRRRFFKGIQFSPDATGLPIVAKALVRYCRRIASETGEEYLRVAAHHFGRNRLQGGGRKGAREWSEFDKHVARGKR